MAGEVEELVGCVWRGVGVEFGEMLRKEVPSGDKTEVLFCLLDVRVLRAC